VAPRPGSENEWHSAAILQSWPVHLGAAIYLDRMVPARCPGSRADRPRRAAPHLASGCSPASAGFRRVEIAVEADTPLSCAPAARQLQHGAAPEAVADRRDVRAVHLRQALQLVQPGLRARTVTARRSGAVLAGLGASRLLSLGRTPFAIDVGRRRRNVVPVARAARPPALIRP